MSSEDEGTLELAENSGATAISRPSHLSSDTATTIEVVQNGILHLGLSNDSHVSVTYPTSILSPETFAHLVRESLAKPEMFLIGVAKFPHPIQRALLQNQTGQQGQTLDLILPQSEFSSARTQDLTTTYFDAGKYYGASASCWMNASEIIGSKVRGYPLSRTESIDIDQEEDWQFAETVARGRS